MHPKTSSAKWRPFRPGGDELGLWCTYRLVISGKQWAAVRTQYADNNTPPQRWFWKFSIDTWSEMMMCFSGKLSHRTNRLTKWLFKHSKSIWKLRNINIYTSSSSLLVVYGNRRLVSYHPWQLWKISGGWHPIWSSSTLISGKYYSDPQIQWNIKTYCWKHRRSHMAHGAGGWCHTISIFHHP